MKLHLPLANRYSIKALFIVSLSLISFSCNKPEPIEPTEPSPFEFKESGTVQYVIQAACNGYPIELIDAAGDIDTKMILTSTWSTSFISSRGDSVRMTLSCEFDNHVPELEGYLMYATVRYQDQFVFGDTVEIKDEGTYPHIYEVTALGVLP